MTDERLLQLWEEWQKKVKDEDPDAHDDYYWHGAASFRDFLSEHLLKP